MVGIAYQNNHDLDQSEIVNLLVTGFSGTLCGYIYIYIYIYRILRIWFITFQLYQFDP